jgi:hypothetical protein
MRVYICYEDVSMLLDPDKRELVACQVGTAMLQGLKA